ncbi:hypothetical protein AAC387_Pa02g1707 [Persea americana]
MASRLLHLSKFSVLLPISNVMFDIGGPEKSLCPTFIKDKNYGRQWAPTNAKIERTLSPASKIGEEDCTAATSGERWKRKRVNLNIA